MELRSQVTPDEVNDGRKTRLKYGILTLPLSLMLPFGLLGFRPGQLFNKIIGYIINLMFLFNYGLILAVTIARFVTVKDYKDTLVKFHSGFAVVMTVKFTILIYIYFKKFNFLCLLEDLTNLRKHSLSKKELLLIITTFTSIVAMVINTIYYLSYLFGLPLVRTGIRTFIFEYNGPSLVRVTKILELLIYLNITRISILVTGFFINVISVVLGREFLKCIENLEEN